MKRPLRRVRVKRVMLTNLLLVTTTSPPETGPVPPFRIITALKSFVSRRRSKFVTARRERIGYRLQRLSGEADLTIGSDAAATGAGSGHSAVSWHGTFLAAGWIRSEDIRRLWRVGTTVEEGVGRTHATECHARVLPGFHGCKVVPV